MSKQSQQTLADLAVEADQVAHKASQGLQGKIPIEGKEDEGLGHPIHPATVHWPIAFLSTTFSASALTLLPNSYYTASLLPSQSYLPGIAHYTAAASVLTALPAIITGLGEGYEMARAQYAKKGSWAKVLDDTYNMRDVGSEKLGIVIRHASMNDAVVALAGFNWFYGWKWPTSELPLTPKILGIIALPALFYSAMLGGKLVYEYAVGVQRQGSGKEIKARAQAEAEAKDKLE